MSGSSISRRQFLKTLGVGVLSAGLAAGCSANTPTPSSASSTTKTAARTLKVLQQTHFVPAFDEWFDKDYAVKWGQSNQTAVSVDHLALASVYPKAASEAAARAGHDVVGFPSPPAVFENEVIDVSDVIQELEKRLGALAPLARQTASEAGEYARETISALGPLAAPLLLERVGHPDASIRRWALAGLRYWGDPAAFQPILARLSDTDPEVRTAAIAALGDNLLLRP